MKELTINCELAVLDTKYRENCLTVVMTNPCMSFIADLSIDDIVMNVDDKKKLLEALELQIKEEEETWND